MTTSFNIKSQSKKEQLQPLSPASFSIVSHLLLGCRRGKYSRLQTWSLLPGLSLCKTQCYRVPQPLNPEIERLSFLTVISKLPKDFPTSPPPTPLQILSLPYVLPWWQMWSKIPSTGEQGRKISLEFLLRRSWWNPAADAAQSLLSSGQCSHRESGSSSFWTRTISWIWDIPGIETPCSAETSNTSTSYLLQTST